MVIGALAGGIANGLMSSSLTKQNAKAYKQAAKDIREAGQRYSGQSAYDSMQNAGNMEGNIVNRMQGANQLRGNANTAMANASDIQNNFNSGYNLGSSNEATTNNALYNAETAKAQQAMNQANINYKAGTAVQQAALNTAGGLADLYKTTSDERCKEYNNKEGLPKASAEDALRQIESISFKYKPETGLDQDEHVGVTAQSLEGTAFDDVVSENKDGIKQLDKQKLQESVMAGIAALQKEVDDLSASKKTTSDERCKEVENAIESNPNEAADMLSGDIKKEAEQATDGGVDAEVRNDVVNEAVEADPEKYDAFLGMLSYGKRGKRTRAEAKEQKQAALDDLDRMSTEDMRAISEMGDTDNPYMPETTNGTTYGDDYKALVPSNGTQAIPVENDVMLPAVVETEPIEEQPITYAIEEENDAEQPIEEVNDIVDEDAPKELTNINLPKTNLNIDTSASGISGNVSNPELDRRMNVGSGMLGTALTNGVNSSAAISPASVSNIASTTETVKPNSTNETGVVTAEEATIGSDVVTSNQSETSGFVSSNGGNLSSGGTNKTSSLKASKSSLPNKTEHTAPENNIDLKDATISALKEQLKKMDVAYLNDNGIQPSGETFTYNETALESLNPEQLSEVEAIVRHEV